MELPFRKKTFLCLLLLTLFANGLLAVPPTNISDSLSEHLFVKGKYRALIRASRATVRSGKAGDMLLFRRGVAAYETNNYAIAISMFEKIQSQYIRKMAAPAYLRACKKMYQPAQEEYLGEWAKEKQKKIQTSLLTAANAWLGNLSNPNIQSFTLANDGFAAAVFPRSFFAYSLFAEVLIGQRYKCVFGYTNNSMQTYSDIWNNFDNKTKEYTWKQQDFYGLFSRRVNPYFSAGLFYHSMHSQATSLQAFWSPDSYSYSYFDGLSNSRADIIGAHFLFKNTHLECEINPSFLQFGNTKTLNLEVSGMAYPLGNQHLITYLRLYATSDSIKNRNLMYAGLGTMPFKNTWIKGGILWGSIQNQVSSAGSIFSPIPDNTRHVAEAEAVFLAGRCTFSLRYNNMLRYTDVFKINMPDVNNPATYKPTFSTHTYRTQSITFSIKYRL